MTRCSAPTCTCTRAIHDDNGTLPFLGARDCYSEPEAVYRVAKARGMDLVAITDHDTIDGALELLDARSGRARHHRGRGSLVLVAGRRPAVHLGVYGMTESLHRELQPLRRNVFDVVARLREAAVFFALNHLLHFYRPRVPFDAYLRLLDAVPALEVTKRHDAAGAQPAVGADGRRLETGRGVRGWLAVGGQRRAHAAACRHDVDRSPGARSRRVPVERACGPRTSRRARRQARWQRRAATPTA